MGNEVKRPAGLVPGSYEWIRQQAGPRIVERLAREVDAQPIGQMTPTGARCAALIMDRYMPVQSVVHHKVENQLASIPTDQLMATLKELLAGEAIDVEAIDVTFREEPASTTTESDAQQGSGTEER